jgi:hypothetical protein
VFDCSRWIFAVAKAAHLSAQKPNGKMGHPSDAHGRFLPAAKISGRQTD